MRGDHDQALDPRLLLSTVLVLMAAGDFIPPSTISSQQLGTCAIEEQREQAREMIRQQTLSIIRDSTVNCNPGGRPGNPAASCDDIPKDCSSGWYWLATPSEETVKIYCDLERKCGCNSSDDQATWMRIAFLDMTDPETQCPEGLRMIKSPKHSCRRSYQAFQTSIVPYRTYGFNYSHVCGRIIAYQYGITDGLGPINTRSTINRTWSIDQRTLDGIVVTHGQPGSRKHNYMVICGGK